MWNNFKSVNLSLWILRAAFAAMAVLLFLVPAYARWYDETSGREDIFLYNCIFTYAVIAIAFVAAIRLNSTLMNIKRSQVFVHANIKNLRILSYCCFGVSIVFFLFAFLRPISLIAGLITAFLGLILRVVKNVFSRAVEIREENDAVI